ncbi:hypothetical protein [Nocardia aurantiaca]|uniref:Uncharacterized protein n=1 Tax=Nocardia aurantiaca TaxID=2675850 RepID=A0A6I3L192_9NOCA|nr:hypothetical protein [Nocardia aurantiaca]MTE14465.1 hypothetical protein [Nocardia aurantiaca]
MSLSGKRHRHGAGSSAIQQRLAENWDDWVARAAPLGVGPVLLVDTTREVDHAALASQVQGLTDS